LPPKPERRAGRIWPGHWPWNRNLSDDAQAKFGGMGGGGGHHGGGRGEENLRLFAPKLSDGNSA